MLFKKVKEFRGFISLEFITVTVIIIALVELINRIISCKK